MSAKPAPSFVDELADAGGDKSSPTERGKTRRTDRPDESNPAGDEADPADDANPRGDGGFSRRPPSDDDGLFTPSRRADSSADRARPGAPRGPSGFGPEIDRGRDALALGEYQRAIEAFKAAMSVDKKSPHAHHGMGLAYHGLGNHAKAVESLEKAATLGTNRAIVHNLAVIHMKVNPMRSAKFVREFLTLPATPLDEPLQNVLGVAMVSASDDARVGATFAATRKFYMEYDHRLAVARRDGNKRWGMRWIPAEDADVRWAKAKKSAEDLSRLSRDAGRAAVRTKKAYNAVRDIATSLRLHREREKRLAQSRYRGAVENEQVARKRLDEARGIASSTEQPQFPSHLQLVPLDALDPAEYLE